MENQNKNVPTVFFSYSHDSVEHKEWVKKLATDLRGHGVNVILDQWDLRLGADLAFFMEQGLSANHLVLCICSEQYVKKAELMQGGVGYEKMIITGNLLDHANSEFFIPIIRNNPQKKLPIFMKTKFYVNFCDDKKYFTNYLDLLYRIHNEDSLLKPPIGPNPFKYDISKEISIKTLIEQPQYQNTSFEGHVAFLCSNNNGTYTLGIGENTFILQWNIANRNITYIQMRNGKIGVNSSYDNFPNLSQIDDFNFSSSQRTLHANDIIVCINSGGKMLSVKLIEAKSRTHGDNHDEVTFSYKIYTILEPSKTG